MKKSVLVIALIFSLLLLSACLNKTMTSDVTRLARQPIDVIFDFEHIKDATPSEPNYQYTIILKNTSKETYNLKFSENLKYSFDFVLKKKTQTILETSGTSVWNEEGDKNSFFVGPGEEMVLTKGAFGDILPRGKYLVDFHLYLENEEHNMKFDFEIK